VETPVGPAHDHGPGHTPTTHRTPVHTQEQGNPRIRDRTDHAPGHQVHLPTSTDDLVDTPRTNTDLGIELLAHAGTAVTHQKGDAMTTLPNIGNDNLPEKTKHTTFQNQNLQTRSNETSTPNFPPIGFPGQHGT
jgi:hypothetical protein